MKRLKIENWLDKIMYIGLIVLAGVLPLPVSCISMVIAVLLLAWVSKMILSGEGNFKISSLEIPIFIFLGVTFLSVIFSIDSVRSFKGLKKEFLVLTFFFDNCQCKRYKAA
ncbi:hypothetical protein KAI68_02760 [bacterium]|nr:hypothetical protein [bacterium]